MIVALLASGLLLLLLASALLAAMLDLSRVFWVAIGGAAIVSVVMPFLVESIR